ncbi:reverse transcriptase domain-containing protein [Tanacetum coccineum]
MGVVHYLVSLAMTLQRYRSPLSRAKAPYLSNDLLSMKAKSHDYSLTLYYSIHDTILSDIFLSSSESLRFIGFDYALRHTAGGGFRSITIIPESSAESNGNFWLSRRGIYTYTYIVREEGRSVSRIAEIAKNGNAGRKTESSEGPRGRLVVLLVCEKELDARALDHVALNLVQGVKGEGNIHTQNASIMLSSISEHDDEDEEPTPQPKTQNPKPVKETPLPKPYKPKIPYPQRLRKEKMEAQYGKFLDMIRAVRINVPLIDVLAGMPNYGKFLKELISNKHKIEQISAAFLSDESSAMIQNKVPPKLGDPGSFLIPCNFDKTFSCNALADLGASINLMPYSLYAKLSLKTLKPTKMSVRLADRSFQYPVGIAKNMLVEVGKFTFPVDFVILEMEEDSKVPLILGRPFLHTADAVIRVKQRQLNLGVGTERIIFNIDSAMKHSYSNDDTCFSIDVIDEILEEDFDALLDEGSKILHSIEGTLLEEEIFAEFDEFMAMTTDENSDSESETEDAPFKKITINTNYKIKTSLEEPPTDLELKPLPDNLEYVFLEEPSFLPVIISSQLSKEKKSKLIYVLTKHKQAFAWKTTDIPGIFPSFCKHKIQLLDDKKPVIQKQRTLNPNMQEVVKKEIVKLLDTDIIYLMVDSPWVSPIHCVPKKGGITVVTNEKDELVPTRTITGWREKCHFMVKEGIVLGHKVSSTGLEVDKAKIDVILKLPPTNIKGVRSFLGHAGFYRCFIEDFSKIARPLTKLLEKDTPFEFNGECQKAFGSLKEKLTCAPMIEPYLFKVCSDGMIRRCISGPETRTILDQCHHGPTGGHYGPNITAKKVLDLGFYRPTIIKEAHTLVCLCEACQRTGNISKRDEIPLNNIQVCEIFDIWGIDFMGPFPKSYKFEYILVSVDYVSKWAEAQALPTNDARVVVAFLKKLFCRFGMPKALISDRDTHFCNKIMEKTMKRYGVNHCFSTSYNPQTSGQVENTNRALKRITKKTVKDNPAIWSRKLDDALWAFRIAYKTPTDLIAAGEKRMFQLHELNELRHQAYENSRRYKERTTVWHDRKLRMRKEFKQGNKNIGMVDNSHLKRAINLEALELVLNHHLLDRSISHGKAFALDVAEAPQDPNIMTGTFSLNDHFTTVLFDSGADYSFISTNFLPLINMKPNVVNPGYEIEIASGLKVITNMIVRGMDWLSKFRAKIVCYEKIVQIPLSSEENLEVHEERPEGKLKQLKTIKVNEPKLEDIPVVGEFSGVFPEDLTGLPLISTDKSKITRIQSKSSKHGHENQKSTKAGSKARKVKPQSNPVNLWSIKVNKAHLPFITSIRANFANPESYL